jgi:molybdopterin-guanine dinucleotide biosynthesis protein A
LLERALAAVRGASRIVLVGPPQHVTGVIQTLEEPPGGGPVAGIEAGLKETSAGLVLVLAVDYPLVDETIVGELVAGLVRAEDADGVVLADDAGREQPLAGCYRTAALRPMLRGLTVRGASVRTLIGDMKLHRIMRMPAALDCDTPEDFKRLERAASKSR